MDTYPSNSDLSLLPRRTFLYCSGVGFALPPFLFLGVDSHGQHVAFDTVNNYSLSNLYLSMLQRMDIELDRFATSTGTMRGLEVRA